MHLSGVAVVWYDGDDIARAGTAARSDHEDELDEVVVDGWTRGLDNVHILPTHTLLNFNTDLHALCSPLC